MVAVDNKCLLLGVFMLVMYFTWMDIALWYHLQALVPSVKDASPAPQPAGFTVFAPITVKLLMIDPFNHYMHLPVCYAFTQVTHFGELFSFITPNMISLARVVVIIPGLRMLLSDSLCIRQAGIGIILAGEWMDTLDGFVARMRRSNQAMQSDVGMLGYFMDGICDGVSAVMLMVVCLVYLKRHPPRQAHSLPLQLPVIGSKSDAARLQESKEGLLGSTVTNLRQQVSSHTITVTVVMFGMQQLLTSVGWNHVIAGYQRLLENGDGSHTAKQLAVLQASSTWILMWFWRVLCFHSIVHSFLIAIFFDKLWEFLVTVRYVGFVALFALITLNELHLQTIQSFF